MLVRALQVVAKNSAAGGIRGYSVGGYRFVGEIAVRDSAELL